MQDITYKFVPDKSYHVVQVSSIPESWDEVHIFDEFDEFKEFGHIGRVEVNKGIGILYFQLENDARKAVEKISSRNTFLVEYKKLAPASCDQEYVKTSNVQKFCRFETLSH